MAAVLLIGVAAGAFLFLRDDDDRAVTPAPPGGKAYSARQLMPSLQDLGLRITEEGKDPAAGNNNSYRALYRADAGGVRVARIDITVHGTEQTAQAAFNTVAEAMRNPPPDFFAATAKQIDAVPLGLGNEAKSYQTDRGDSQGQRVYTDVYRFDRAVVVVSIVATPDAAMGARQAAAERIQAGTR